MTKSEAQAYLRSIAFDQATKDWLDWRSPEEIAAIKAFVDAHEKPLSYDCSDGPNLVLNGGLPSRAEAMREAEHACCGWSESRMKLEEWDHEIVVGSCHGH